MYNWNFCKAKILTDDPKTFVLGIYLLVQTCKVNVHGCSRICYVAGYFSKPVDRGGSVGSDEPPRLHNGPFEVFRKLLYWLLFDSTNRCC